MYYKKEHGQKADELIRQALRLLYAAQTYVEEPGVVIRDDSPEDLIGLAIETLRKSLDTIENETTRQRTERVA